MQTGKNVVASVKETAGNIAASAISGMDKTKASVQEKVEKMTAHNPAEKEMAKERKDEKIQQAEINKQEARQENASKKESTCASATTSGGVTGHPSGQGSGLTGHTDSALPGHNIGQTHGQVTSGVVSSHPTEGPMTAHNPMMGSAYQTGYGSGHNYNRTG